MAAKSNYLENKIIDFMFRGQSFTRPDNVYVALFTSSPGDAATGTEVSGGGYARVAVSGTLANWAGTHGAGTTTVSSGSSGTTSNNNAITFPAPTANWGTVTHFALFDASTSGNMLYWSSLTTSKTINNGDSAPRFPAGSLVVSEN